MNVKSLNTLLKTLVIPVAYRVFKTPQTLPYIVFFVDSTDNEFADNSVYKQVNSWQVELYCDTKNPPLERSLEAILPPYNKVETFIDTEQMFQIAYSFETYETEETNG